MIAKGKRLKKFEIEIPPETITPDMVKKMEKRVFWNVCIRYGLALVSFVSGGLLIMADVNREGILFKVTIGNSAIEYIGSYVGVVFFLGGILITLFTRYNVRIKAK